MNKIFISFHSKNYDIAISIYHELSKIYFNQKDIFFYPKNQGSGDKPVYEDLKIKINQHKLILIIWSQDAINDPDTWMNNEIEWAKESRKKIFICTIGKISPPATYNYINPHIINDKNDINELCKKIKQYFYISNEVKEVFFYEKTKFIDNIFNKIINKESFVIWAPRGSGISYLLNQIQNEIMQNDFGLKGISHSFIKLDLKELIQHRYPPSFVKGKIIPSWIFWDALKESIYRKFDKEFTKKFINRYSIDNIIKQVPNQYYPIYFIIDDFHLLFDEHTFYKNKPRKGFEDKVQFKLARWLRDKKISIIGGSERNYDRLAMADNNKDLLENLKINFIRLQFLETEEINRIMNNEFTSSFLDKNIKKWIIETTGGIPGLVNDVIRCFKQNKPPSKDHFINEMYRLSSKQLGRLWDSHSYWEQQYFKMISGLLSYPLCCNSKNIIISELFKKFVCEQSEKNY